MEAGSPNPCSSFATMNPFVQAQLKKLESYPRQSLPRYLFRCYSIDHSQGINDPPRFYSAARHNSSLQRRGNSLPCLSTVDLAAFSADARKHLTYTRHHGFKSPFVSFTSSLLVALGCARKADLEDAQCVKVAIIDTKRITSTHPIFPCADLKDLVNSYLHDRVLIPGDSVDEFLAYDSVEVEASYASLRDLMAAELFDFVPELYPPAYYRDKWPRPTLNLRDKLFARQQTVTEREYHLLRQLSSEFHGEECQLALTVHLLSLRDRFVETDPLLRRAMTASFRLAQLESFLSIEDQYDIGPASFTVYKYTSAGHGVSTSPAPELKLYSAPCGYHVRSNHDQTRREAPSDDRGGHRGHNMQ
jgi:hypothetical protein